MSENSIKKKSKHELMLALQLDLFKTSKINLSALYTAMPLETQPKDARIQRDEEGNVKPVPIEETFTVDKKVSTLIKIPAVYTSSITKKAEVRFPYMREARVENAIMSILSKKTIGFESDSEKNTRFFLHTSIYAIRKEIVEAINSYQKKQLTVENCPLKYADVRDALDVLTGARYKLQNPDIGDMSFNFSRIKDYFENGENFTIEIGSFISKSIETNDWNALEPSSLLASKEFYEYRLKLLLYSNFRNAKIEKSFEFKGTMYRKPYTATLDYITNKVQYDGYAEPSRIIQHFKKIVKNMSEVDEILITPVKDGRKLTLASKLHFIPSESFVNNIIENNILARRAKKQEYIIDEAKQEHHIKPLRTEYSSDSSYQQALFDYQKRK